MLSHIQDATLRSGSESSPLARWFYAIAIPGCVVFVGIHGLGLVSTLRSTTLLAALFGLVAGIAAADFLTGVVHWACDTWGSPHSRWLGPGLIHSFREHHRSPALMLRHDWLDINGGAAVASFSAFVLWAGAAGTGLSAQAGWGEIGLRAFGVALLASSAFANQLHCWAHDPQPPAAIEALQRFGILLSRVAHGRHHRAPHLHGYCISTGWLNRPLDAIGFWRFLEAVVSGLSGARPRADQGKREGHARWMESKRQRTRAMQIVGRRRRERR